MARFADYLRHNEFSISPAAVHEAIQLAPNLEMKDRFEFQSSLSQLWVKHPYEQEKFNECLKEFFFYQIQDKMKKLNSLLKLNKKWYGQKRNKKRKNVVINQIIMIKIKVVRINIAHYPIAKTMDERYHGPNKPGT